MRVFGILLAVLLAGCSHQSALDTWQGASLDQLVLAYGAPDKTATLSDGGQVVEYQRSTIINDTQYNCRVTFLVDQGRRVVNGKEQGACGGKVTPR